MQISAATAERAPSAVARWLAAVICILYGFAKLNGSQFTVLDSELTKPLGEVSGFWLTWHYFGYSPVYGNLLALIQIAGGILLVVPRTSLAAALLLLPVAANILLIDLFYGVDLGGIMAAAVLLLCLCARRRTLCRASLLGCAVEHTAGASDNRIARRTGCGCHRSLRLHLVGRKLQQQGSDTHRWCVVSGLAVC